MALPAWPAAPTLPEFFLADGFSATKPDGRLFTKMSSGPPKVRRLYSSAIRLVQCAILCTATQRDNFETFWVTTLDYGTSPFTKVNPMKVSETWTLLFGENAPQESSPDGVNYRISMQLYVLP